MGQMSRNPFHRTTSTTRSPSSTYHRSPEPPSVDVQSMTKHELRRGCACVRACTCPCERQTIWEVGEATTAHEVRLVVPYVTGSSNEPTEALVAPDRSEWWLGDDPKPWTRFEECRLVRNKGRCTRTILVATGSATGSAPSYARYEVYGTEGIAHVQGTTWTLADDTQWTRMPDTLQRK